MSHPCLLFCPYLPLSLDEPVTFADWELGPLESFKNRWADPRFKELATAFLSKFVVGPTSNERVSNPALLCRKGQQLDGQPPLPDELRALELSLVFALVDKNPRNRPEDNPRTWTIVTADNAELYAWPIDLEQGRITLTAGELVTMNVAYKISDPDLVLPPPRDLHIPTRARSPDPLMLTGVYETVLRSLRSPGGNPTADRVRVAVEWWAKAWSNTQAVQWPERLVYLKTAFEALTGTSTNWKSARKLRKTFEALPHTTEKDSDILVWSQKPAHTRTWVDKNGQSQSTLITDLELWFMAFGNARNTIIHKGGLPEPTYSGSNRAYNGPFIFTGEFLLRGVIKVLLSELGYNNAWRSERWRTLDAAYERGGDA